MNNFLTNKSSNSSDELASLMEDNLSGKTASLENNKIEKTALLNELKEGIELFEENNSLANRVGAQILKKIYSNVSGEEYV